MSVESSNNNDVHQKSMFNLYIFSAYDEKLVENVIETINPGILCCLNTNLADEVKISDVGRKGYGK